MTDFDVIVVGAGIMGHAAAWYLVHKENQRVLLIDQFPFPTTRNSSTGHSRIYRRGYEDDHYVTLMDTAMPLWRELEKMAGTTILNQCGLIFADSDDILDFIEKALWKTKTGSPCQRCCYPQLLQQWPQLQRLDEKAQFIYDPSAGFISADVAMDSYHTTLMRSGRCTFLSNTSVLAVHPSSDSSQARVVTDKGEFVSRAVVLTPGPWAGKLLSQVGCPLPLEPQRVAVAYFKVRDENDSSFRAERWPTYINHQNGFNIYAVPEAEYRGMVKFGNHIGVPTDPDRRDSRQADLQHILKPIIDFVSAHVPALDPTPAIIEHCTYCCTPDHCYVIDRHPRFSNVVIGTGFSGHGFKMAPAVGDALGRMCVGKRPTANISAFGIARLTGKAKL